MDRSIIVLELNELVPVLMERYIDEGRLPAFKRLRDQSYAAITDAGERPPFLEPWIQWETVHSGLAYADHGVFELGQGGAIKHARIWDLISRAGRKVWVCGSMNASAQDGVLNGYVLSDPWSTDDLSTPAPLFRPYMHLVRRYVQEHTRKQAPVKLLDYLKFSWFMATNGLSVRTCAAVITQMLSERRGKNRWRRATILDRLQWDVFRHHYRRLRPAFATFFVNSTAHFQHFHWRNLEPEAFEVRPTPEDQTEYKDAILFGYQRMDQIVAECLDLAGPNVTVVLCTALGQQAMAKYEETAGKALFRPVDVHTLTRFAGVEAPFAFEPVMADEFHLKFDDEAAAAAAEASLLGLRIEPGREFMRSRRNGSSLLVSGFPAFPLRGGEVVRSTRSNQTLDFDALFYPIGSTSGMHHPDGLLWIQRPNRQACEIQRKVSIREIAPTLLGWLGLDGLGAAGLPPMPEISEIGAPAL